MRREFEDFERINSLSAIISHDHVKNTNYNLPEISLRVLPKCLCIKSLFVEPETDIRII